MQRDTGPNDYSEDNVAPNNCNCKQFEVGLRKKGMLDMRETGVFFGKRGLNCSLEDLSLVAKFLRL